jgi:hypothetical protein
MFRFRSPDFYPGSNYFLLRLSRTGWADQSLLSGVIFIEFSHPGIVVLNVVILGPVIAVGIGLWSSKEVNEGEHY